MREIPKDKVRQLVLKEGWLGMTSGVVTGVVTALVAWAWHGNPWLGLVIGLAMVVNLCAAGQAGTAIHVAMKVVGLNPAQCSSIILTTVTDVVVSLPSWASRCSSRTTFFSPATLVP